MIEKITKLPENLTDDEYLLDALYYRLQISINVLMDLIAMLCKDLGIIVRDNLKKKLLLDNQLIDGLRFLNGLRYVLNYKYNKIDEKLILNNKEKIKNIILEFIENLERILNEKITFRD
ncbi:MAG: HepT-like ribonuclease domain-containing protein [Promethearchaeota archaeon]